MTDPEHPPAPTTGDCEEDGATTSAGRNGSGEPASPLFLDSVADAIVSEIGPATVLDAACGGGFLVAALRRRGVEAWGIDASESAIAKVPVEVRSYCSVASLLDELDRDFDLITCIDVLERLSDDSASAAVANLARHTERVLLTSTTSDPSDLTRPSPQRTEYWVGLFAGHGFFRTFDFDATFVAPQAIHLRRTGQTAAEVARAYEHWHSHTLAELHELRAAGVDERAELATARRELGWWRSEAESATEALTALESTRTFRYMRVPRGIYAQARAIRDRRRKTYAEWVRAFDTLTAEDRKVIRADIERLQQRPLISVLLPVYNPPARFLARAIESVRSQLYENWELCIADDASTDPKVLRQLREYSAKDTRIKVVFRDARGSISAASNSALDLGTGEFVALLDHDDELARHALYLVARELDSHPDAAVVFSDEDRVDAKGQRADAYFKPDWNPDLFRSQNFIGHLGVYRRSAVQDVGGFRVGFEGSHDYDLALRIVERVRDEQIRHVPAVLYHVHTISESADRAASARTYAPEAARAALRDHLTRTGRAAEVQSSRNPVFSRLTYALPHDPPLVSVVVPTRDGAYFEACIESLRARTTYSPYEIVVVDNQSGTEETKAYLRSLSHGGVARVLTYEAAFNHSAICNLAARHAGGEVLCLLNDDVEVLTPGWLEELVSHALRPGVGAVGAKLLYPDGRIQHAGVVLGLHEIAGHVHQFKDARDPGYSSRAELTQNYTAVTGACLVVRASIYEQLGGFDEEHLPHISNDVDFCLRLRESGYWNVWTPYAELIHHESATRRLRPPKDEEPIARHRERIDYLRGRWGALLTNDPAYNPNLTLETEDFSLAWPPRTDWPWVRRRRTENARKR